MYKPSNPAPLYPAIGWVGNLLLFAFNLCVLPRAPPIKIQHVLEISLSPKIKGPAWWLGLPSGLGEYYDRATKFP